MPLPTLLALIALVILAGGLTLILAKWAGLAFGALAALSLLGAVIVNTRLWH